MRVPRLFATVALLLLAASIAAGCSDDGDGEASDDTTVEDTDSAVDPADEVDRTDDSPEGVLVASLATGLQTSFTEAEVGAVLPADEAECTAEAIVGEIGVDRLTELGVTADAPDRLDAVIADTANTAERAVVADALSECVDLVRTFTAVYVGVGLSEQSAVCAAEGVVADPEMRSTLVLGDEPTGEVAAEFDALAQACFTPDEQERFASG